MHRTLRLTVFLLMGLLPLAALLAWGMFRHTETYRLEMCKYLGDTLGMPVEVERFHFLRPNKMRLDDVRIFGVPPSDTVLLRAPAMEVARQVSREDDADEIIRLTLPELTLSPECLWPLWELHQRILAKWDAEGNTKLEIVVQGPVRVAEESGENRVLELHHARLRITPEKDGRHRTDIAFQLSEGSQAEATLIQLSLRRSENGKAVLATLFADEKRGIPVPLLRMFFPTLEKLGERCRFYGEITAESPPTPLGGWNGRFRGRFENIDLSRPFQNSAFITGTGMLALESAEFSGGGLVRARGTFRSGGGAIHRMLLDRIISFAGLTTGGMPLNRETAVPYTEFAFAFTLADGRINWAGMCGDPGSGVFLAGKNGTILRASPTSRRDMPAADFFEAMK